MIETMTTAEYNAAEENASFLDKATNMSQLVITDSSGESDFRLITGKAGNKVVTFMHKFKDLVAKVRKANVTGAIKKASGKVTINFDKVHWSVKKGQITVAV